MTKNYKSSNGQKQSYIVKESFLGTFCRATGEYVEEIVQSFGHSIILFLSLALVFGAFSLAGIVGALAVLSLTSVIIFDSLYSLCKKTKWAWMPVLKFAGVLLVSSITFLWISCLYNPAKNIFNG